MDKNIEEKLRMTLSIRRNIMGSTSTLNSSASIRSSLSSLNFSSDQQTISQDQKTIIMKSIQIGLDYSLTKGVGSTIERDVLMKDFTTVEATVFPCDKDNVDLRPFTFKTYAPLAFRYFRYKFGIQQDDYIMSFCNSPLREVSNSGASGSMFFITRDDEFIIKTVNQGERKFLNKLLPGYLLNLNQNPYTLLPKFFGFYCYKFESQYIRFVAMNNFIPSNIKMHQKYDLKGSTLNRFASKTEKEKPLPTFKDLDFKEHHPNGFFLQPSIHKLLIETLSKDCRVLESFRIMDYSLLLGVHNLDIAQKEKEERRERQLRNSLETSMSSEIFETDTNDTMDNPTNEESYQAVTRNYSDKDFILSRNGIPAVSGSGEKILLFIGIIDILESYGTKKKLEHRLKGVLNDRSTISAHNPSFYAQRFMNFVERNVFKKIVSSKPTSGSRSGELNTRPQSIFNLSIETSSDSAKAKSSSCENTDQCTKSNK